MAMVKHPKSGRGRRGRPSTYRPKRKHFLIICEGEVTEVAYFRAFPVAGDVKVNVKGEGKNTTSLVAAAIEHADRETYTDVWVVYDHDDFGAEKFNAAQAAVSRENDRRSETWRAAWSNQAFEVWYLLHFQYFDGKLHRHLVQEKVGELLRKNTTKSGYKKNDPDMYSQLKGLQEEAIKRAERLEEEHSVRPKRGLTPPADANPCTTVHHLVVELNQEIR